MLIFLCSNGIKIQNQIKLLNSHLFYHTKHQVWIMWINQKVNPNFKIWTTFEPMIWWLLLISLLLIWLVNIKLTRIFLINYAISLIDNFECCLLTKQSKRDFNKIKTNCFVLKLVHFHQNQFINDDICYGLSVDFSWWQYSVI